MSKLRQRILLPLALFAATASAQTQDTFDAALNRGLSAFKTANYAEAVEAFQQAVDIDPKSSTALLDLGTSYAYQLVPQGDPTQNLLLANKAISIFMQVPTGDPGEWNALKQTARLYRDTARFEKARDTERAALKLKPDDADTHYTIGVIDWTQAYRFASEALVIDSLTDDGMGNTHMTSKTCKAIRDHNLSLVDDALAELTRAVELNPAYADAMQYLNLVYRRKADFDCTNSAARTQDIESATTWTKRAQEVKAASFAAPQ